MAHQGGGGDGDVIQQTKAHRAVGSGVVTRRTGHDEADAVVASLELLDDGEAATGRSVAIDQESYVA